EQVRGLQKPGGENRASLRALPPLGEMLEPRQRLLEAFDRLPVGGACECLGAGLTKIGERPIPHLAAESVVSEPLDLLGETITIELLDRIRDPGMQGSSSVVEQTLVCHVVSESVLERVLDFRVEDRLVKELGGLQAIEPSPQRFV